MHGRGSGGLGARNPDRRLLGRQHSLAHEALAGRLRDYGDHSVRGAFDVPSVRWVFTESGRMTSDILDLALLRRAQSVFQ